MPRRSSFFSCFGLGGRQPEIQYEPDKDGLQQLEFSLPMPEENELNVKFSEIVDELDLTAVHRKAMFDLPAEKKWQIYCSRRKGQQESTTAWPDYYVDQLKNMTNVFFTQDDSELEGRAKFLEEVKTALRTQPMSFVLGFLDLGGLQCLIDILASMDWDTWFLHAVAYGWLATLLYGYIGWDNERDLPVFKLCVIKISITTMEDYAPTNARN